MIGSVLRDCGLFCEISIHFWKAKLSDSRENNIKCTDLYPSEEYVQIIIHNKNPEQKFSAWTMTCPLQKSPNIRQSVHQSEPRPIDSASSLPEQINNLFRSVSLSRRLSNKSQNIVFILFRHYMKPKNSIFR